MSQPELRVAVIGTGAISRDQHLPAWVDIPNVRVVALADASAEAVEQAGELFHVPRRVTDYRRLLDDPSIDAVDICVPSALHAEVAVAALDAGKHVLCEKPMATSRAGVVQMLEASRRAGRKLMVAQHLRFHAASQALLAWRGEQGLGPVYYGRAQWLRRRRLPGRPGFTQKVLSGGGALYDIGVHMLDLAWWLMGCPRPVTASGGAFDRLARREGLASEWGTWDPEAIDVEDFAAGLLRFEGGGLLSLEASWLGFQPERDFHRVQLFGTRAGAVWPDARVFGERDGRPWDIQLAPPRMAKAHRELIRHFAQALLDDQPVPIPPHESATVIAMLESLYRSSEAQAEVAVEAVTP